jgi:hypothetical protein
VSCISQYVTWCYLVVARAVFFSFVCVCVFVFVCWWGRGWSGRMQEGVRISEQLYSLRFFRNCFPVNSVITSKCFERTRGISNASRYCTDV